MKVIAETDQYTIFQKRNERYGVRGADRRWINGDEKITILLEHKLIEVAAPKPPEPESAPEVEAEAAPEAEAVADTAAAETADAESADEKSSTEGE